MSPVTTCAVALALTVPLLRAVGALLLFPSLPFVSPSFLFFLSMSSSAGIVIVFFSFSFFLCSYRSCCRSCFRCLGALLFLSFSSRHSCHTSFSFSFLAPIVAVADFPAALPLSSRCFLSFSLSFPFFFLLCCSAFVPLLLFFLLPSFFPLLSLCVCAGLCERVCVCVCVSVSCVRVCVCVCAPVAVAPDCSAALPRCRHLLLCCSHFLPFSSLLLTCGLTSLSRFCYLSCCYCYLLLPPPIVAAAAVVAVLLLLPDLFSFFRSLFLPFPFFASVLSFFFLPFAPLVPLAALVPSVAPVAGAPLPVALLLPRCSCCCCCRCCRPCYCCCPRCC